MEREALKNDLQALIEYFMDERGASPLCLQECLEILEQEPCDKYITEIDHLRKYISKLETQIVEQEHCDDCVNRQAVLEIFGYAMNYLLKRAINVEAYEMRDIIFEKYKSTAKKLSELPPVAPQPKIGHWVDFGAIEPWFMCSECNERVFGSYQKYCPNCGTRMEVEK